MSNINKLYRLDNKCIKKSINIDTGLYNDLRNLIETKYDATISDLINIAIEDYVAKEKQSYYGKPKGEFVTYRSVMLRQNNIKELKKMNDKTRISVTRLINGAIKEFIETANGK